MKQDTTVNTGEPGVELSVEDLQDQKWHNVPLYCVYGSTAYPTIIGCIVSAKTGRLVIWGFSRYNRSPGFRTLGVELAAWALPQHAKFFSTSEAAFAHIMTRISHKNIVQLAK